MKNSKNGGIGGFTLIKLLVVIAIIGILSSIVLASLNTARAKGSDANVKSNLDNLRSQATIVYDSVTPNSYVGLCTNDVASSTLASAMTASGDTGAMSDRCHDSDNAWNAWVLLKTDTTKAWCVDNSGTSEEIDASMAPLDATTPCPTN